MALTVATNTGALMAQAAASSVNKEMEISMERLSTGKRINGASDDAAGVAIASRLTSEIRGTNQAIRNAMDGQALIDTAEGAHQEIENILQRMRELAVQAANDTNDSNDRANLALEMAALTDEIDRIADVTSWAGQILLDGASPDSNATDHSDEASFDFQIGSGTNAASDVLTVDIGATTSAALGLSATSSAFADAPQGLVDYSGLTLPTDEDGDATFTMTVDAGVAAGAAGPAGDEHLELTVALANSGADPAGVPSGSFSFYLENQQITVTLGADNTTIDNAGVAQAIANAINDAGIAGITANAGIDNDGDPSAADVQVIKAVGADISSGSAALTTIGLIDAAITTINGQRASLGSASNRLDSTVSNLTNISANLQAGRGRIEDADFAAETTSLAKSQILQQASTAMLAQANASKQNVLSLLQG